MEITNTLSQKKEELQPRKDKELNLFVCGPTVYDYAHIGHARTYVAFDVVVKYLRSQGYNVNYVQNITDIDDKIIARAAENKEDTAVLAKRFEELYYKDMKALGVTAVDIYAKATDYLPEIISQIERLLEKGFAYELKDGVYFDVTKFAGYGKLSRRTSEQAEDAISRIDEGIEKKNKADFALWKISKDSEPQWDSPWGKGRPGWHIEDTAITEKHFGSQYDIHGGARDLIFPHHEAEISQMEAISGKEPLVNYWMHTGFLTVGGEKMAKSLGNFITIQDFISDHSARLLRYFLLKTHYRSPIDYSEDLLGQATAELERIDEFVARLQRIEKKGTALYNKLVDTGKKQFKQAMNDDFNTPEAIAVLFDFLKEGNTAIDKGDITREDSQAMIALLQDWDTIFGVLFREADAVPKDIQKLVAEREEYRIRADWDKTDELREHIQSKGWTIQDTPGGPVVKKQT